MVQRARKRGCADPSAGLKVGCGGFNHTGMPYNKRKLSGGCYLIDWRNRILAILGTG